MNLIAMNCPQCGAKLEVKPENNMPFCPYCGSKISISFQGNVPSPTNDLQLGLSYLQMGKYKQSDACFSRLLEKLPTSNLAWFWKAINSVLLKKYKDAALYWHKSEINAEDSTSLIVQGMDKPGNPAIEDLLFECSSLATQEGGWELMTAILQAGLGFGKQDFVIESYEKTTRYFYKPRLDIYDYILTLDPGKRNMVIESVCIMP